MTLAEDKNGFSMVARVVILDFTNPVIKGMSLFLSFVEA